jgi:carotenoid 1,2-hydratase
VSSSQEDPATGFVPDPAPLRFDLPVVPGGYAWWYLDVVSDDGALTLTVIAFIGSVFSPRYAKARRAGPAEPQRFAAVNVALVGRGGREHWALNERSELTRTRELLTIGRSSLRWQTDARGQHLVVELDELETRFGGRRGAPLRGRVRLYPSAMFGPRIELDRARPLARHRWYPVAPHARAEVELDAPALRFSGSGYHDVNAGDEALEHGFAAWNWSRAELDSDRTAILYDLQPREAPPDPRGWVFSAKHRSIVELGPETLAPAHALPPTRWRVARAIRSDPGHTPRVIATLADTPFYSRNLIDVRIAGRDAVAVHESLSLDRFASRFVQFLLRFKIRAHE